MAAPGLRLVAKHEYKVPKVTEMPPQLVDPTNTGSAEYMTDGEQQREREVVEDIVASALGPAVVKNELRAA